MVTTMKDKLTTRIAYDGVLLALAMILGFIDNMIPMPIPVPGVKLGLANLVVLYAVYKMGNYDAILISVSRVLLSGLMFAGMSGIMYSLAGAVLSLTVMILMHKLTEYHIICISVCGSISHILGQLLVAAALTSFGVVVYYAPVLLISATVAGTIIGIVASAVLAGTKDL